MRKDVDSRVLEKIRKLLSLAESDNEHESAMAMARANELILRHNLSVGEISESDVTSQDSETVKVNAKESTWIFTILQRYFFVKIIEKQFFVGYSPKGRKTIHKKFCYIGEPLNLEVAFYTEAFLRKAYKRLWEEYKVTTSAPERSRQAYYSGLTAGIMDKLNAQKGKVENETGLVWKGSRAIDRFVLQHIGLTRKGGRARYSRDVYASGAGRDAGRNLELTKALKRDEQASQSGRFLGR